jgi:hypothetical protein
LGDIKRVWKERRRGGGCLKISVSAFKEAVSREKKAEMDGGFFPIGGEK